MDTVLSKNGLMDNLSDDSLHRDVSNVSTISFFLYEALSS